MSDVQRRLSSNRAYYDRFAAEVAERNARRDYSRAMSGFTGLLEAGATILDVGCGAGAHMLCFERMGFRALGVEPSSEMRRLAKAKGLEVVEGSFETLGALELPAVSGIWCAASLLHVPTDEVAGALKALRARLPESGPLFITVRLGSGGDWDKWDGEKQEEARFLQLFSREELETELMANSLAIVETWTKHSAIGKSSEWISFIAKAV